MARLKGDLTSIDLMVPFSTRPGGRVFDLSKGLHFEVMWDGSSVVERFTGDLLNGSGHTTTIGPGTIAGFTVNGVSNFPNLVPNLSWANDEFTISFWVKFLNTGFTSSTSFFGDRQFDFIAAKKIGSGIPGFKWKFSTQLKRNIEETGVRAYFGVQNYEDSGLDLSLNFCDTYNNEAIKNADRDTKTSLDYPSENILGEDISFNTWKHIVIRSKTRKNDSNGLCELWLDGRLISKYVPLFLDQNSIQPDKYPIQGSGVLGTNELTKSGKIIVFIKNTSDGSIIAGSHGELKFIDYVADDNDLFYLSNHSYAQIAKWDRILSNDEIEALYYGSLNNVYVERFTSYSAPPKKNRNISYESFENKNFGYFDFPNSTIGYRRFDDSKIIEQDIALMGKNIPINMQDGEEHLEMSTIIQTNVMQNNAKSTMSSIVCSFDEKNTKGIFICPDNTIASSVIKIDVSSIYREDNQQYAGRTDSKFARKISTTPGYSMFLSSAIYRDNEAPGVVFDSGVAGTGFLYYSPTKKCWVEKRSQHETSRGINTSADDAINASSAIEINPYTNPSTEYLAFDSSTTPLTANLVRRSNAYSALTWYYSSKIQITGSHEILRQFTASPQLGYFTNNKEELERMGYKNIGSPTIAFGAPFSSKYHAFDNESIKMKNFIDGPFTLKKVILKIPVEIRRKNEPNLSSAYEAKYKPVAYFNFEEIVTSPAAVEDLTGNAHNARLTNFANVALDDTPGSIEGRGCLDLTFDASSTANVDNLKIDDEPDLRLSSNGLSISFWVKFSDLSNNQSLFYKASPTGGDAEYYLFYDTASDSIRFRINDEYSSAHDIDYVERRASNITSNSYIELEKWHHICATFDGNLSTPEMKIYIDGIRRDDVSSSNGTFSNARIYSFKLIFGSRGTYSGSDIRGKLASITIWNREINNDEARILYTNCLNSLRYSWDWTKNVTIRKDMDNYVFFLYRQRRNNEDNIVDSKLDISSSERFLIGSGSVCVYNSSSFGLSKYDGFIDAFGINTPITGTNTSGLPFRKTLNEMFRESSNGENPIAGLDFANSARNKYTKISSPLHGPSVAIDTGLNNTLDEEEYLEKRYLEIEITPSFNLGGFANNTLMYLTTSKGHLSTSFLGGILGASYDPAGCNKLFNWYPQKGSYDDMGTSHSPPLTTIFQNFWLGGTRQPEIILSESNGNINASLQGIINCKPHYQFNNDEDYLSNNNSLLQDYGTNKKVESTSPEFDIEIARTGLSFVTFNEDVFELDARTVSDSRGKLASLAKDYKTKMGAVFQRTELIQAASHNDETTDYITGTFSINTGLKNASFVDLLASLTTGYAPVAEKSLSVYNPYTLLPEDELILGLDAGVTPPPDIAPYFGKNMTDMNESGQHKVPNSAFINPILKEQIWHYAGNSYIRILPGDAQLLLIGDYTRNGLAIERERTINSNQISTVIGNEPVFDQYDNAETDAYISTMLAQAFDGNMTDYTRKISRDDAKKNSINTHTMKRYFSATSKEIVIEDLYISGTI